MDPEYYSTRTKRRKNSGQDRFLNWAIAVVAVLILIVGGFFIVSIKNSPTQKAGSYIPHQKIQTSQNNSGNSKASTKSNSGSNQSSSNQTSQSNQSQSNAQGTGGTSNSSPTQQGQWQPIGTTQKEPHHTSFNTNSEDWKEMKEAISYATGISVDKMVTWWIGNNGAPNLTYGIVSSKSDPTKYKVTLKWVKNKGWEPTSLTKVTTSQLPNSATNGSNTSNTSTSSSTSQASSSSTSQ